MTFEFFKSAILAIFGRIPFVPFAKCHRPTLAADSLSIGTNKGIALCVSVSTATCLTALLGSLGIFCVSNGLKMFWVDAISSIARMVKLKPIGDYAAEQLKYEDVHSPNAAMVHRSAIASALVYAAEPQPTTRGFLNSREYSRERLGISKRFSHRSPPRDFRLEVRGNQSRSSWLFGTACNSVPIPNLNFNSRRRF